MDEKRATVIPTGTIFTASSGAYSDYTVAGVFRALKDIDTEALLAAWLELHPVQKEQYRFKSDDFFADTYLKGFFEPVDSREWHLTEYSDSDAMRLWEEGPWTP